VVPSLEHFIEQNNTTTNNTNSSVQKSVSWSRRLYSFVNRLWISILYI